MATAGEHANFTIAVKFSGASVTFDDEWKYIWDNTWSETVPAEFVKLQGAEKGADGYILLDTISVSWNGDDDGSGYFVQEVDLGLVSPGDNTMSTVPTIFYNEPGGAVPIIGNNFTGCGVVGSEFPCP